MRPYLRAEEPQVACCDCVCRHECHSDPTVIGGDHCVVCRWCQCDRHKIR